MYGYTLNLKWRLRPMKTLQLCKILFLSALLVSPILSDESYAEDATPEYKCEKANDVCIEKCDNGENVADTCYSSCDDTYNKCLDAVNLQNEQNQE